MLVVYAVLMVEVIPLLYMCIPEHHRGYTKNYKLKLKINIIMYLLEIKIESDSGVGPYTETIFVANCSYKNGKWYKTKQVVTLKENAIVSQDETKTIEEWFHTGSADCTVTVMKFTEQKGYYR
jgi:hypothetical protein